VITTRFGGLPELFDEGPGLTYSDPANLATAVRNALGRNGSGGPERVAGLTHARLAETVDAGWKATRT
jgi:hypothetical protein